MITCANCGHENHDNAGICDVCGKLLSTTLIGKTTVHDDTDYEVGKPMWGKARLTAALILNVEESNNHFILPADEIENLILGRRDPQTGSIPSVDLTDSGAADKGVSRQHAFIKRVDHGVLAVIDNNSPNGTFLNGQRLVPHQPRILRDGDAIRLGHLTLKVIFDGAVQPQK
ncbi:MAG: FHA domain-containing protein [Anaerolineae bacterium]|nr:FHA domain-containing protein [Anaerolineae bacterium]